MRAVVINYYHLTFSIAIFIFAFEKRREEGFRMLCLFFMHQTKEKKKSEQKWNKNEIKM